MIGYHVDANAILAVPYRSKTDADMIKAYKKLMRKIKEAGLTISTHVLDNECSAALKAAIKQHKVVLQKVPPHVHRSNAAKRAIRTFKDHFVAILAGIADLFPMNEWDLLLNQAELTLNLLRNSHLNPKISAYAYMHGPFNYNATPLAPMGAECLVHNKASIRKSWGYWAKDGWYVGPRWSTITVSKCSTKTQKPRQSVTRFELSMRTYLILH